jgi:16S rRNA processing protein RimM
MALILDTGKENIDLKVEGVKFFKQFVILKFEGYDSIESIEKYRKKSLYVTRENAVKLKKDEYFIADLMGCKVFDDEGKEIGELTEVMQTGANDVYVVKTSDDREVLFPAIKECVKEVNVEEGKVIVHVMDGLMDI